MLVLVGFSPSLVYIFRAVFAFVAAMPRYNGGCYRELATFAKSTVELQARQKSTKSDAQSSSRSPSSLALSDDALLSYLSLSADMTAAARPYCERFARPTASDSSSNFMTHRTGPKISCSHASSPSFTRDSTVGVT